jgi:hypothetical protein
MSCRARVGIRGGAMVHLFQGLDEILISLTSPRTAFPHFMNRKFSRRIAVL